jgi:hypothetical protein
MAWDETPSYLRLGTDELEARARQALALLGIDLPRAFAAVS